MIKERLKIYILGGVSSKKGEGIIKDGVNWLKGLGCRLGASGIHQSPQRWDGGILDKFFSSRIFPKRLAASIAQPQ